MVSWILSALLATTIAGQSECTIVYFGAPNCQPCEQIGPALGQLKQEGWDIRAVNASAQPELAQQYQIQNLPTLVILCGDREVDRVVGAVPYDQLAARFQRAAARMQSSPVPATTANTGSATAAASASGPIVRGQSAGLGGFPLLASSSVASSLAHPSAAQPGSYEHAAEASSAVEPSRDTLQPHGDLRAAATNGAELRPAASPTSGQPMAQQPTAPSPTTVAEAIARAAAATVRIKVEEANTTAYGTGTIIDAHGREALVLTCGHLFREMRPGSQLSVDLFAGTPQEVNVTAQLIDFKADAEDIGLLSFTMPVPITPVDILPGGEQLQIGQPAFSFGCDHGQDPTRRDTRISNIDRYVGAANVEIVGAPAVGRSGGGLFDLRGRLIGVCNAADATDDEGIYAAAAVVYAQIERLGMSHLFKSAPSNSANSSVQLASNSPSSAASHQLASSTRALQSAPAEVQWPDQALALASASSPAAAASVPAASRNDSSPAAANPSAGAPQAGTQEIICIVRDSNGLSRVVTIPGPSAELMHTIEQHAGR